MTVTKTKNGKWLVDISDGYSHLTGERIRHRKKDSKRVKKLSSMKLIIKSINFIRLDPKTDLASHTSTLLFVKKMN